MIARLFAPENHISVGSLILFVCGLGRGDCYNVPSVSVCVWEGGGFHQHRLRGRHHIGVS